MDQQINDKLHTTTDSVSLLYKTVTDTLRYTVSMNSELCLSLSQPASQTLSDKLILEAQRNKIRK